MICVFRCFSFSFIISAHRTGVRTPKFAAVVTIQLFTFFYQDQNFFYSK